MTSAFVWLGLSYLLGAIPSSYLAARVFKGIDLREQGSRNLGATNVYRVLGWKYAIPVGLFDAAKGAIPVWLSAPGSGAAAVAALLRGGGRGGSRLLRLRRFQGREGRRDRVRRRAGACAWALLAVLVVWAVLVWLTGYVSLGSVVSAALFPLAAYFLEDARGAALAVEIALAAFIIWKHRVNLQRLVAGTENRFARRAS